MTVTHTTHAFNIASPRHDDKMEVSTVFGKCHSIELSRRGIMAPQITIISQAFKNKHKEEKKSRKTTSLPPHTNKAAAIGGQC